MFFGQRFHYFCVIQRSSRPRAATLIQLGHLHSAETALQKPSIGARLHALRSPRTFCFNAFAVFAFSDGSSSSSPHLVNHWRLNSRA